MTPTEGSRGHILPATFLSVVLIVQMRKPRPRGVKELVLRLHSVNVLGSQSFNLSSFFYKLLRGFACHKPKQKNSLSPRDQRGAWEIIMRMKI